METTKKQRLIEAVNFLMSEKIIRTKGDFAEIVGIDSSGNVTQVLSEKYKRELTEEQERKFLSYFPQISAEWYYTGIPPMLKEVAIEEVVTADVSLSPDVVVGSPLVFGDIVLPPPIDGELVAYDEESYQAAIKKYGSCHLVPEYSVEFRGGDRGAVLDSNYLVGHWMIPNAPRGAFIITMVGRSMEPLLQAGSRLLLAPYSFSPEYPNSIKFGEVFGVVVRGEEPDEPHEAYIKIIRKHPEREERKRFWIARSANEELFDDFDIPIHRVTHLYRVITSLNNIWGY